MMNLVLNWSRTVQIIPENYVFPVGQRPGSDEIPLCQNIPVIDLSSGQNERQTIQEILDACQEFGFFQVINHGVSEDLIDETMKVVKDFFDMPDEDKTETYTMDQSRGCRLHTSGYNYETEKLHYWRDHLEHNCHPLNNYVEHWPRKPAMYRAVVGAYTHEVRNLSLRILELIGEGLKLEPRYFEQDLSGEQSLLINHYPSCNDPDLTLGLPKHADSGLITVLLQGSVYGLQVFNNGEWLGVEPLPHAFVVNVGHQLEIISNGKLKSAEHRAVTNSREARTSIVSFIKPYPDTIVEPAKSKIDTSVPLYGPFKFKDFFKSYVEKKGNTEALMEFYKIKP